MRENIDTEYFRKRLEQRLKELTDGQTADRPLELDQSQGAVRRLTVGQLF